jgi:enoyl-CoA hydratase/carnithine racemase
MALMGEVFTADQALALGIVDQVVPQGEGVAAAEQVVDRLRARSPRATELTKMMVNAAEGEERERVIEALAGTIAAASPDLARGLAAFREKRKPDFQGD